MLGEELYNARINAGMTQEMLSHKAGVDRSYISQLENNKWSPTVEILFRLCDALGIKVSELMARVEATRKPRARKK
jgi:transcriptional regulator with XRE-family HTH domain